MLSLTDGSRREVNGLALGKARIKVRRRLRWRWLLMLVTMGGLLTLGGLYAINWVGDHTEPRAAEVIIVLGARVYPDHLSTALRERLDTAIQLYRQGLAAQVIVSGGQGADEPTTEAMAMRDYLVRHGVAAPAVHLEERSFNTLQNLQNSREIMGELGFTRAILVTSDYHVLRASLIARRLGLSVTAAAAPLPVDRGLRWRMVIRELVALAKDLLTLPFIH